MNRGKERIERGKQEKGRERKNRRGGEDKQAEKRGIRERERK